MLKRFSGGVWFFLSIITFGFYSIYVRSSMTNQHNKMADVVGEEKIMGYLPAYLLGLVTFGIFNLIWSFKFYGQLSKLANAKKVDILPKRTFFMLIAGSIPWVGMFWLCDAHNDLVEIYAEKKVYK